MERDSFLENKIFRPSVSAWATSAVITEKKNEFPRRVSAKVLISWLDPNTSPRSIFGLGTNKKNWKPNLERKKPQMRQTILIEARHFTLCTDHKALIWLHTFKNAEGIMGRLQEILAEYN